MCTTADGKRVDCHLCGTIDPNNSPNLFACKPIESAFLASVSGFSSNIAWLIFSAFQIGKAVQVTLLGKRVALYLISHFGKHSIYGLGYSICFAELILSPFIPSNSARGGSIVFPIVKSVIESMNLTAGDPVAAYLTMTGAHSNLITSSLFLTSMAGNPILFTKAADIFGIEFTFINWITGSFVPGIVILFLVPLIVGFVYRPSYNMELLHDEIVSQRNQLGPLSNKEWRLVFVLLTCLVFWAGSSVFKISSTVVAFVAAFSLILMDVITWNDVLTNTSSHVYVLFANEPYHCASRPVHGRG
ncbi:putative malate transporter YflS [Smittium culicis]|uniref:Putative malate transporter YflS n=1 Tax=Smittium culicis TaxID=133412 RepID=A0A1R1YAE3_9FUNG|nr:putative malate transporter YflS [Smittium culicis]